MNQLSIIREDAIVVSGVEELTAEVLKSAEKIGKVAPIPENADQCAKEITKFNKLTKDAESAVKSVIDYWDEPLKKELNPLVEAIASYKAKKNEYQSSALEAKKEAAKKEAYVVFLDLAKLSKDGNIPDWDTFYDIGWYGRTKDDIRSLMIAKLASFVQTEEPDDPSAFAILTIKGSHEIARAEKALKEAGVVYEKEGNL